MNNAQSASTSRRSNALFFEPFAHPVVMSAIAGVGLGVSYIAATSDPIASWEIELTRWLNHAPDPVAAGLWPVMQLGSLVGPFIVGGAILVFRRDRVLAGLAVAAGVGTWMAAKGIKQLVSRGRPHLYMPDVVVRSGDGTGLGYISGHAAVAAVTAVVAMAVLPVRARPVALVIAASVGIARIVYGLHFPADVIGGWSFGTLVGVAVVTLLDHWRRGHQS